MQPKVRIRVEVVMEFHLAPDNCYPDNMSAEEKLGMECRQIKDNPIVVLHELMDDMGYTELKVSGEVLEVSGDE